MTPLAELKKTHRATWASGDYPAVAERIDEVPPRDLLDRIDVRPGENVLEVATGTGNVALRAAAAGANVVGLDLTPELFATAWRRMDEWGVATSSTFSPGRTSMRSSRSRGGTSSMRSATAG